MIKELEKRNIKFINKIIILGILIIFFLSALFHFLYDITGGSDIAAIFFPVNESIFEHLKLALYPTLIYWLITFLIFKNDYKLRFSKWFTGMTFSIFTCMIYILSQYYILRYALNLSSSILDILSIFIGLLLGQILGCHIYNRSTSSIGILVFCIIVVLLTCIVFANLTFYPPKLPLFLDNPSQTYGIPK